MSIFDHALHIPAERLFFEPQRARQERVLLPLVARASMRFFGAVVLAIFAASACLCMGIEMALSRGGGSLFFASGFLVAGLLPAAIAAVGLRDAVRSAPLLVVDSKGLRDARLGPGAIAWTQVAAAEVVASASGINAVRLTLDYDGPPLFNPCRIGGWSVDWGQRRRSRTIALMLLDVRAHRLAHTIVALAARHGATVAPSAASHAWPLA